MELSDLPGAGRAALVAAGLAAVPALAQAQWRAMNGSEVFPLSNGRFEVVNRNNSRTQEYWCAAGDYAIARLRTSATQRIYIQVPIGPSKSRPGRKAVQFSLSPPASGPAPQSYSLTVKTVGETLTASFARNYCFDLIIPDF